MSCQNVDLSTAGTDAFGRSSCSFELAFKIPRIFSQVGLFRGLVFQHSSTIFEIHLSSGLQILSPERGWCDFSPFRRATTTLGGCSHR